MYEYDNTFMCFVWSLANTELRVCSNIYMCIVICKAIYV